MALFPRVPIPTKPAKVGANTTKDTTKLKGLPLLEVAEPSEELWEEHQWQSVLVRADGQDGRTTQTELSSAPETQK